MQPSPFASRRSRPIRSQGGFSLIEILVALALLGALAGLLIGGFGNILIRGQEDVAQQFIDNALETPLLSYKLHNGSYPSTEQGLQALLEKPSSGGNRWRGPYITDKPIDPWGNPYKYQYPGAHNTDKYDLWSLGQDGVESDDDITNWD